MHSASAQIRSASPVDTSAILAIHRAAFPADGEARLVELLIQRGKATVSLVAECGEQLVGHALFSPVSIDPIRGPLAPRVNEQGFGLAPLAVLPQFQNRGIGTALVRTGLEACHQLTCPYVVVLGSPAYYSRFGFEPASRWNLSCEFGGGDAFQFLPLSENAVLPAAGGLVRYASELTEIFGSPS